MAITATVECTFCTFNSNNLINLNGPLVISLELGQGE